VEKENVTERFT